jgi:hypothetical protein
MVQIFVSRESLVLDVYGVKSTGQFVNTLLEVIRRRGAMDKLITDGAAAEISQRVTAGKARLTSSIRTLQNAIGKTSSASLLG